LHGYDPVLASGTSKERTVKGIQTASRYMRMKLINGDAAAHTMSAWAYLKA
jgi:hypothetical protein